VPRTSYARNNIRGAPNDRVGSCRDPTPVWPAAHPTSRHPGSKRSQPGAWAVVQAGSTREVPPRMRTVALSIGKLSVKPLLHGFQLLQSPASCPIMSTRLDHRLYQLPQFIQCIQRVWVIGVRHVECPCSDLLAIWHGIGSEQATEITRPENCAPRAYRSSLTSKWVRFQSIPLARQRGFKDCGEMTVALDLRAGNGGPLARSDRRELKGPGPNGFARSGGLNPCGAGSNAYPPSASRVLSGRRKD
jgi:hypothetical protein